MIEANGLLSYDEVQERLVEAWGFLMRMPDRERGWLRSGVSSIYREFRLSEAEAWRLYQIDSDDYHGDARPKLPPLSSVEVDRMEEALAWVSAYAPRRDCGLIGVVLAQLQRSARPSWEEAADKIGGDAAPAALSRRYERAMGAVCRGVNAGLRRAGSCQA
ncbi:hypothetical protein [Stakelama tenebrarum]|uniref:Uncharacterized protein n=1 Tax=Stakelama tenebrarum TaxID=2711215 RepID=A0A6G6Y506_9SPHN|nr:hypothetical protein [Sphingosinithalassobacter tenebrarum]QIG79979.1 hypothetical protein G5C33_09460 [Sphingosinithalassobacter tenebrarum]